MTYHYPLNAGHASVLPDALSRDVLASLQATIGEDDYPLTYSALDRVELEDPEIQLYLVRGWVPPHEDVLPESFGDCVTLGLVIEDSMGSLLTHDADGGIPLSPGCVYRIDPRRTHGTVPSLTREERDEQSGVFAFLAADFRCEDEPDPLEFAENIARLYLRTRRSPTRRTEREEYGGL